MKIANLFIAVGAIVLADVIATALMGPQKNPIKKVGE